MFYYIVSIFMFLPGKMILNLSCHDSKIRERLRNFEKYKQKIYTTIAKFLC